MARKEKLIYERVGDKVSIFQRGRIYWANFQVEGKQVRESLKTSNKKEARSRAMKVEVKLLDSRYERAPERVTVGAVIEAYLAHTRSLGRAAKTINKYTTVLARIADLATRRNIRHFANLNLAFADAYRIERSEVAEQISIYHDLVILCQLANFARTRRLISESPFRGLKQPRPKPKRQPCWTLEESDRILAKTPATYRPAFLLLRETGMRIGELIHLTWEDVDLNQELLLVRPKPGWTPKSGDQRAIPLSAQALGILIDLARISEWVVTAPPSRQHPGIDRKMSSRRALRALKRVLNRLGLPGKLHTFRHTFISNALLKGTPVSTLRAWVGHVDDEILKLYTHVTDVDSKAAMGRLSEACGQVVDAPKSTKSGGNSGSTVSAQSAGKPKTASL